MDPVFIYVFVLIVLMRCLNAFLKARKRKMGGRENHAKISDEDEDNMPRPFRDKLFKEDERGSMGLFSDEDSMPRPLYDELRGPMGMFSDD